MSAIKPVAQTWRATVCAITVLFVAGCGSVPVVPEIRYYRLPPGAELPNAETAAFQRPLVVEPLNADGVYNDQSILYALKPDGSLKNYHYQLWNDPPGRMLQRRLITNLRSARMAPLVTDRLPASQPSLRLTGLIERFDRVRISGSEGAERWQVYVALQFRLDGNDDQPLLSKSYRAEVPAEGASIQATVRAFARAIDECFAELRTDLAGLGEA